MHASASKEAAEMDPESIAAQFVTQYYQLFDTNRAGLAALYVSFRISAVNVNCMVQLIFGVLYNEHHRKAVC